MKKNKTNKLAGFTLVEILISIAIMTAVIISVNTFSKDVFSLNSTLQAGLNAQIDLLHVVKVMVAEIREASPSNNGAYPLILVNPTTISFYSDINGNGLKEKIRYFTNGNVVQKGVVTPSGSPLTYNDANEKISTVVSDFVASSTAPLFQYFPSSYTGTSSPLSQPVDISSVRLVKITVIIDRNPNQSPVQTVTTSQVSIRNLKDNL